MKIIAKKDSNLEQTIKDMYEGIISQIRGGMEIVEKYAGVRPENIYHLFHWGTISRLTTDFAINKKDEPKIKPKVLRKEKGEKDVWVPALRYKEGKALADAFRKYANESSMDDKPLREYGINTVDMKKGKSYYCQPVHDEENDRYLLLCSNSIPEAFDKQKLAKDQFDIEY